VRNAITHTYGYANRNPAAYSYTKKHSGAEAETVATSAPKSVVAIW